MNTKKTKDIFDILRWTEKTYNPNLFISLQLPFETKTDDRDCFERNLWLIVKRAEKNLLGRHWVGKHYRFVGFYELGRDDMWHAHLLMACPDRDQSEIEVAFAEAGEHYKRTRRTDLAPDICIEKITALGGLVGYCTKQLGLDYLAHINSDRVFLSEEIFNHDSRRRQSLLH